MAQLDDQPTVLQLEDTALAHRGMRGFACGAERADPPRMTEYRTSA
jgi:hypothetical protein